MGRPIRCFQLYARGSGSAGRRAGLPVDIAACIRGSESALGDIAGSGLTSPSGNGGPDQNQGGPDPFVGGEGFVKKGDATDGDPEGHEHLQERAFGDGEVPKCASHGDLSGGGKSAG